MIDINVSLQTACPICDTQVQPTVLLPQYPITEAYVDWTPEFIKDGFLDQALYFCGTCHHAYLEKILDVRWIYSNYVTTSAASQGAINCLKSFSKFIERHVRVSDYRLLLDIGGNDSTFLSFFKELDLRLVNVDPNASGGAGRYETVKCFLEDVDLADYKRIEKKIVVSSHTIEHLAQPTALIRSISQSLNSDDYCFLQFPSIESLVENLRFDQICHQHINYFSLTSIAKLLNKHGLHIIDYEYDYTHFGTLRVAVSKKIAAKSFKRPAVCAVAISKKYDMFQKYYSQLNECISPILDNGTGFGAGLMVPTLAYHLPIINSLKYIVDENDVKHGKRFINLQPKIVPLTQMDIGSPIMITSISTKSATRAIFNKLVSLGVENIVSPTILT